MRLVTWNCCRGGIAERAGQLAPLRPDLIALQECTKPVAPSRGVFWRGRGEQPGVGVVAGADLTLEHVDVGDQLPATVLPALVLGPVPFLLVNIWALPHHTFEEFALNAASTCAATVGGTLPTVLIGDFNSSPAIAFQRKSSPEMLRRLRADFGLVSAYHTHHGVLPGREAHPTLSHPWEADSRFHIDYCFLPEAWAGRIRSVEVADTDGPTGSDHRPLLVDVNV